MNNRIANILRFLLFFPMCLPIVGIYLEIVHLFLQSTERPINFWNFILLLFLVIIIWVLNKWIAYTLISYASLVSPVKYMALTIISILAIIGGIYAVHEIWTQEGNYSGGEILYAVIFTFLLFKITFVIIQCAVLTEGMSEDWD